MALVFNPITGNFDTVNDVEVRSIAGEAIQANTLVGVRNGGVVKANAGAALPVRCVGFVKAPVLAGQTARVSTSGRMKLTFSAQGRAYLGESGQVQLQPFLESGGLSQVVGEIINDELFFSPEIAVTLS